MKIAFFKEVISPEVGCHLGGYGYNDVSVAKLDELLVTGVLLDDEKGGKILLVSYDLLGLDAAFIDDLRKDFAAILNMPEAGILMSCTHTHTGPQTRSVKAAAGEILNTAYLAKLREIMLQAVKKLAAQELIPCIASYYSMPLAENRNRRYVTADNHATFLPHRVELRPIATGITDNEFGLFLFRDKVKYAPIYVIGNYAAHPLAGHAPGLGGLRISPDFPGYFRDFVKADTGAESMFITGAAGDLTPLQDEQGIEAMRQFGVRLSQAAMLGIIDMQRNPGRFTLKDAKVGGIIREVPFRIRSLHRRNPDYLNPKLLDTDDAKLKLQCVNIGDVAIAGVPGELCCELGLEIKWHSPFRRTFIAYNSTGYISYICPGNFFVQGGYEVKGSHLAARASLQMVNEFVDALYELHQATFPELPADYPDGLDTTNVNIPPNR